MPDMTGWTPVLNAAGETVGWMAPADVETPHEEELRRRHVRVRAAAIGEVADLAASEAFDLDEVCAAGEERIGERNVDAALGVVWELMQVERPDL